MADEIPQWALVRACELTEASSRTTVLCLPTDNSVYLKAFASYIAAHEEPPVDPLVGALKAAFPISLGSSRTIWADVERLRDELHQRGLEIREVQP